MALDEYLVTVKYSGVRPALADLVERFAHRVPVTEETMAQLDVVTQRWYRDRIKRREGPAPTELAARCLRNASLSFADACGHVETDRPRAKGASMQRKPVKKEAMRAGRHRVHYSAAFDDSMYGMLRATVSIGRLPWASSLQVQTPAVEGSASV